MPDGREHARKMKNVSNPVLVTRHDWFFQMGLQAAGWSTATVAASWLDEELFSDLE